MSELGYKLLRDASGGEVLDRCAVLALGVFGAIKPTDADREALADHLGLEAARWIIERFDLGMIESAGQEHRGMNRVRAIDLPCPECGARAGDPCMEKRSSDLKFARREIKSIHPGRQFEAWFENSAWRRRPA